MIKRIEFDELGNVTAVEFYEGTVRAQDTTKLIELIVDWHQLLKREKTNVAAKPRDDSPMHNVSKYLPPAPKDGE